MPVTQPAGFDDDKDDFIRRQQIEHAMRDDPKERFTNAKVEVEDGPADAKTGKRPRSEVTLRYALDSTYVFAVYGENPAFESRSFDEWASVAGNALQKFAATKGLAISFGPRSEDGARYNIMVEMTKPVEVSEEARVAFEKQRQEREAKARREAALKELGLTT